MNQKPIRNPYMRISLLFALLLTSLLATAQPIYKTVDDEGRVTYSDQPPKQSQQAESPELPPLNSVPEQRPSPSRNKAERATESEPEVQYTIELMAPQPDAHLTPEQRDLPISVYLDPALQPEHTLIYYLDDEPVAETRSLQHTVQEIYRGTHTVQVEVLDAQGQTLSSSDSVTIHVHRPSLLSPGRN